MLRRCFVPASLLALLLLSPARAEGSSDKSFTYSFEQIWRTTVRYIRADLGYTIRDKDQDTGYILFTFPGSGEVKECAASLEVVSYVDEEGYAKVRVQLSIAHQPSYIEVHFLDKLERKLFEEQGQPPQPRKAKQEPAEGKKGDEKKKPK